MPTTSMTRPKSRKAIYWTPERSGRITIMRFRNTGWSFPWIVFVDGQEAREDFATHKEAIAFAFGYVEEMRKP